MSENKYCGNCKHFKDEDAEGYGCCEKLKQSTYCSFKCHHEFKDNGWAEITPDNVDEIDDIDPNRVVIARLDNLNRMQSVMLVDCRMAITTMVKWGGYYYYVLPKLMKEK